MSELKNTPADHAAFNNKIHNMGIISTLIIWCFFIGVPLSVTLYFGLGLEIGPIVKAALPLAFIFMITGACEKLSMAPVIGPGAVYIGSITGNMQNMKLPAALNAMSIMGCEEGSEKGRVIAIIAVGTSAFVTTAIVFLGMLFLAPFMEPLLTNPVVQPAFDNIFPALIGPMVIPVVLKNVKVASVPVVMAIILALLLGSLYGTLQSVIMVVVILISIGIYKVAYRKKGSGSDDGKQIEQH